MKTKKKKVRKCQAHKQIFKQIFAKQDPQRDSGSAGAKKVLDALVNDTEVNFQVNILGKVRFQKK